MSDAPSAVARHEGNPIVFDHEMSGFFWGGNVMESTWANAEILRLGENLIVDNRVSVLFR